MFIDDLDAAERIYCSRVLNYARHMMWENGEDADAALAEALRIVAAPRTFDENDQGFLWELYEYLSGQLGANPGQSVERRLQPISVNDSVPAGAEGRDPEDWSWGWQHDLDAIRALPEAESYPTYERAL